MSIKTDIFIKQLKRNGNITAIVHGDQLPPGSKKDGGVVLDKFLLPDQEDWLLLKGEKCSLFIEMPVQGEEGGGFLDRSIKALELVECEPIVLKLHALKYVYIQNEDGKTLRVKVEFIFSIQPKLAKKITEVKSDEKSN